MLGERERRKDLLIEHLHLLQDHFGCLHAHHLRALADELRLSQVEVYEVASFYDHFDIVKEGEVAPPPLTIRVCDSLSCMMAGAEALIAKLEAGVDPQKVRVVRAPCMGGCDVAPAARIGDREIGHANVDMLLEMAANGETQTIIPDYIGLEDYRASGGYSLASKIYADEISFDELIGTLSDAGLRGLGGAGFPAGTKWKFVRGYEGPRLMTINGDEGEPGTFKDRYYLERDPHRTLEGALIAAHAVDAERIYFYMRDEYPAVLEILRREIAALESAGWYVRTGVHRIAARGRGLYLRRRERHAGID